MLKNKVLIFLVVGIVIIAGIGFFVLSKRENTSEQPLELKPTEITGKPQEVQPKEIKELKAEDLSLILIPRADKKAVIMTITNLSGISSIEYEGTYDVEVKDGKDILKVGRGVGPSTIEVKPSDTKITRELELGSCSRNVCKYDKVVSDIMFIFKINYLNGEIGSIQQEVNL